jgi:tRNA-Thr(GGU) m(6)t(6)A37 methyltransferase TsaA
MPSAFGPLSVIGIIRTSFKQAEGTPIQPVYSQGSEGTVEILPEYSAGLSGLEGVERIWLLYWFHACSDTRLRVVPFLDDQERGVFATRAPCRPNRIGLSCVRLKEITGDLLKVVDVDILDQTPLLDIKPYIPDFDAFPKSRCGWFERRAHRKATADDRYRSNEPDA